MVPHKDDFGVVILTIGDEYELSTKGGTFDAATGENGIRVQHRSVGAWDEDARTVRVVESARVGWKLTTLIEAIGLSDQDVRKSDPRRIVMSRGSDEEGSEDLVVDDVDLVVDMALFDFEENEEEIAFGRSSARQEEEGPGKDGGGILRHRAGTPKSNDPGD